MENHSLRLVAQVPITIKAPVERVWAALTTPELIKQYFFGVEVVTDWRVGSPIVYRGAWEGKTFEDKGRILDVVPQRRLRSSYWTAFSGLPDRPENYQTVTYELSPDAAQTRLTVSQDNIPTEAAKTQNEQNWGTVLESMKKMLEKN